MLKISIQRVNGQTYAGYFETQEEANAWIAQESANESWGKNERWIAPDFQGNYAEDISQALESREVDDPNTGNKYLEYHLAAEYKIEQTDITTQVEFEKSKQAALAAQAQGAEIIAYVTAINDSKAITIDQVQALLMDAKLQEIQQCLWVGALQTAKLLIQNYDNPFYSAQDKANILALFP